MKIIYLSEDGEVKEENLKPGEFQFAGETVKPADGEAEADWNSPIADEEGFSYVSGIVGLSAKEEDNLWDNMSFQEAKAMFQRQIKVGWRLFISIRNVYHEVVWAD